MSTSEKPYVDHFCIHELPDSVFRTKIGRISGQSKGLMAGCRQGVDKHLFYGLDTGHLALPDDQTFTGGFHHLRCYVIELINAGNSLRLRQ
jgi:hypothetical protein